MASIVEETATPDQVFRTVGLIDRGGANLLVGTVIELTCPVPVENRSLWHEEAALEARRGASRQLSLHTACILLSATGLHRPTCTFFRE